MLQLRRIFLLLACSFTCLQLVKADDSLLSKKELQQKQIDSFISALHNRGYFNGTLLVAKKGDVYYHNSFGLSDLYNPDTLLNSDRYQMASVSKPITAAAIMLLVQQGEIDLDDKITKYLPELINFHRVHIRHLLNHTSGIPEYIYRAGPWWKKDTYMTNDDLLTFLSKKKYRIRGTPGSKFAYCNTNYALLASIVERVTEEKFDDFVQKNIFEPAGMCNTVIFNPAKDTSSCREIKGYHWSGRRFIEYDSDYRNGIVGDKGVFSTADDMMRFSLIFKSELIWCHETCDNIFHKTKLKWGGESEYGMGWRMREWDDREVVLHYGFWNSFRTGLITFPETDVTFVILNNLTGARGGRINNRELIIRELMKIMFPEPVEQPVIAKEDSKEKPAEVEEGEGEGEPQEGEGESH